MEATFSKSFLSFLTLISFTSQISLICAFQQPSNQEGGNVKFIKTSCKVTTYPELCYKSLSTYASTIQTSPKTLASSALSVTLATTQTTLDAVTSMSKTRGMAPKEVVPVRDCLEMLRDTVDELQNSINEMGQIEKKTFELTINDLQTWVSAALTNEDTCMGEFDGKDMDVKLKTLIRGKLVNVCHLTSIALSLINQYASLHT